MNPRIATAAVVLSLLVALGWWLRDSPSLPPEVEATESKGQAPATPPRVATPSPARSAGVEPVNAPDETVDEAASAISSDGYTVRCPSGGLSGATLTYGLDGTDNPAAFVGFVGDDLVARVRAPDGAAAVHVDLAQVGVLRWSNAPSRGVGHCTLDETEWVTVSGRIEGEPGRLLSVRGCGHAEIVQVDAQGRFALSAPSGLTCYPFAFFEEDGHFGKGKVTTYVVDGSPLVLAAPMDKDILDLATQKRQLSMFLQMERSHPRADPLAQALGRRGLSDEARGLLQSWARSEDEWTAKRETYYDELESGDAELYRNLWLGLY